MSAHGWNINFTCPGQHGCTSDISDLNPVIEETAAWLMFKGSSSSIWNIHACKCLQEAPINPITIQIVFLSLDVFTLITCPGSLLGLFLSSFPLHFLHRHYFERLIRLRMNLKDKTQRYETELIWYIFIQMWMFHVLDVSFLDMKQPCKHKSAVCVKLTELSKDSIRVTQINLFQFSAGNTRLFISHSFLFIPLFIHFIYSFKYFIYFLMYLCIYSIINKFIYLVLSIH